MWGIRIISHCGMLTCTTRPGTWLNAGCTCVRNVCPWHCIFAFFFCPVNWVAKPRRDIQWQIETGSRVFHEHRIENPWRTCCYCSLTCVLRPELTTSARHFLQARSCSSRGVFRPVCRGCFGSEMKQDPNIVLHLYSKQLWFPSFVDPITNVHNTGVFQVWTERG